MKLFLIAISSFLLSACTKVGLQVANIPAKFSDNRVLTDISFGDDVWQKLDLYIPPNTSEKPMPVVVFFYGGRWESGSKDMYAFIGNKLADAGYVTVIADYRKYPEVKFPAFVQDAAKALAWVDSYIEGYGADRDKIFVSGHSAGAHIGALLTVDEHYLKSEGKDPKIIKAFAGLSGPYDFEPKADDLKKIFATSKHYSQMQVTTFIDGSEPPMLLLWGDEDKQVDRSNLDLLADKCKEKGVKVETNIYSGVDHVGIIADQIWFFPNGARALEDVVTFFNTIEL